MGVSAAESEFRPDAMQKSQRKRPKSDFMMLNPDRRRFGVCRNILKIITAKRFTVNKQSEMTSPPVLMNAILGRALTKSGGVEVIER